VTSPQPASGALVGGCAFAANGMTNSTYLDANGNARFLSRFLYADLILNNQFKTGLARLPINLLLEYENNLNAAAHPFDYTVKGAVPDPVAAENKSLGKQSHAYMADISIGQQKKRTTSSSDMPSYAKSKTPRLRPGVKAISALRPTFCSTEFMVCGGLLLTPPRRSPGGTVGHSIRSSRTRRWHRNYSSPIRPSHTSWLLARKNLGSIACSLI